MEWLASSADKLGLIIVSTVGIYVAIILFTRLNGLRTFSKMSSFDFAITVAFGSVVASTVLSETPSLLEGTVALGALVVCQRAVSWARYHQAVSRLTDNTPVLLMAGDTFFKEVMAEVRVTEDDIYGKLREANVLDFGEIQAVVLEATGDISVLHGDNLNPALLQGVRGKERLEAGGRG